MKNIYLLGIFASQFALAQYDPINYNGALSANGWSTNSGTAGQITALATPSDLGSSLNYPGVATPAGNRTQLTSANKENINKAFASPATTTAFASFLLKVTDVGSLAANTLTTPPGYIVSFSPESGSAISSMVSRISLRKGSAPNTFNLGILNTTGGTATAADLYGSGTPVNYSVGTTYFIVVKYDMTGTTGTTSLWINPNLSSEGAPNIVSSFGTSTKAAQIASLVLRQAATTGTEELDEFRMGTSWKDVVGAALGVKDLVAKKQLISNTLVKDSFKLLTSQKVTLEIFSANGSLVKQISANPYQQVEMSDVPKGIYLLKITENGNVSTIKIVKQ